MKILFLTTHFNSGGITSYICMLAKGLVAQGHEVVVASSGGALVKNLEAMSVRHIALDIQTKSELSPKIYVCLPRLVKLIRDEKIDLIHSQTRITQVMGVLLQKITGIPYISTCHGFYKPRLSRKIFPLWGDRVIAISPAVSKHLQDDFKINPDRIHLILHGIDLNSFPMITPDLRRQKRTMYSFSERPVIGIIARLADVKGHEVLIRAMVKVNERFPKALLLIVGTGKMEQQLRDQVYKLGLEENVQFHPVVNKTAEILPMMNIFVLPSLDEGLGIAILEAQACGLPVIASRVGGLPSIVFHEKNGLLVDPGDSDGLAEAIIRVLADQPFADRLGKAGRENINQNFSFDGMLRKTVEMYEKALVRDS